MNGLFPDKIISPLAVQSWGMTDFQVINPEGNYLIVGTNRV
ncbi:hypothetical protein AB1L05_01845 [Cytobacillus horneckiae]